MEDDNDEKFVYVFDRAFDDDMTVNIMHERHEGFYKDLSEISDLDDQIDHISQLIRKSISEMCMSTLESTDSKYIRGVLEIAIGKLFEFDFTKQSGYSQRDIVIATLIAGQENVVSDLIYLLSINWMISPRDDDELIKFHDKLKSEAIDIVRDVRILISDNSGFDNSEYSPVKVTLQDGSIISIVATNKASQISDSDLNGVVIQ